MVAAMGRGGGKTPERVVQKINEEVARIGQNATARAIGLPLRSVQKYMSGMAEPSQATLEKIAYYFGVSVAWLRGGDFGPLERFLEGIRISGINSDRYNETIADIMGKEGDYWREMLAGNSSLNSDPPEVLCDFFGINEYWVLSGKEPPLLFSGGIVGTVTVIPGVSIAGYQWPENYSPAFPIRSDPRAGGDSPPSAEDIAKWLRADGELRKRVEQLLADEVPPDSQDDKPSE